jgi:hypothetical protein
MSTFTGYTFDPSHAPTVKSTAARSKIDMDLNEIIQREKPSPNRNPNFRQGARPPPGRRPNQQTKPFKPATNITADKKKDNAEKSRKRSFELDVPESALRSILEAAGLTVPHEVTVKLIATRRREE